jgi:hypothetical protein
MARIAISYRRADSSAITGRIYDRLVAHFGKSDVFMDVEDIPVGVDFREHIRATLRDVEVLLVMIGPHWAADGGGPSRLRDRADPVRLELDEAFARQIRIIPVLIEGAVTPPSASLPRNLRTLSFINAANVESGRDFNAQMSYLIGAIDEALSKSPAAPSGAGPAGPDAAAAHDRAPSRAGPASTPRTRDLASYYVILPALLLLVGHYTIVNWLDLDALYLRVVCFAVPLVFGFVLARRARTGVWASLALAAALAVLAVTAMTISEGLNSGQPIIPQTRQEWRDNIVFVITIAGGFVLGWAVVRVVMQVIGNAKPDVS